MVEYSINVQLENLLQPPPDVPGWNEDYRGPPIEKTTIQNARTYISLLRVRMQERNVQVDDHPSISRDNEGGIDVAWYRDSYDLLMNVETGKPADFLFENKKNKAESFHATLTLDGKVI